MGHLFLDIETYVAEDMEETGTNPYLPKSKIIVISYSYYNSFRPPSKSEIKSPTFLKEWELGEKKMLLEFLSLLRNLKQSDKHLKIHGFNVLKFDLPYIFGRMKVTSIAGDGELHDLLFRPFSTDMMQLTPVISRHIKDKEQIWGLNQKDANRFFDIHVKEGTGKDCSRFYDIGDYGRIMEYCIQEFTFEQLMDAFYLHILNVQDKLS